jgi:hypothetical protein
MRRAPAVLAVLALAACSSAPEPEPASASPAPAPAPADPKAARVSAVRAEIEAKRADLRQADQDLEMIAAERRELEGRPASAEKTRRLAELARLESESRQKKASLQADVTALEKELARLTGTPAPAAESAEDALERALAAEERRRQEERERAEAERRRRAEAERARPAEPAKEKPPALSPAPAAGGEGLLFEERWARIILAIRQELEKYKRW